METQSEVRARFEAALDSVVEKLREDRCVIAAILGGSLSHSQVWRKSDIDLFVIVKDDVKRTASFCLVEEGVNIHAYLMTRRKFKEDLEGSLQSSFFHSTIADSRLLFSTDETLQDYYENIKRVGSRDRDLHLLRAGSDLLHLQAKAEKWLYVRHDPAYSFVWALYCVDTIARIEVVLAGKVPGREAIHQALSCSPELFQALYTDFIAGARDEAAVRAQLERIDAYLTSKARQLFRPILEYLAGEGGVRTTTELDTYFGKQVQRETLSPAYEWLADVGTLRKVSLPVRLTPKSSATVNEAAYYYDGGNGSGDGR